MASGFAGLIAVMAIMVVIFLSCRAIVLWYWGVNEGITLLKSIDEKLGLLAAGGPAVKAPAIGAAVQAPAVRVAPAAKATETR